MNSAETHNYSDNGDGQFENHSIDTHMVSNRTELFYLMMN